jgi:hypothetical protein
VWVVLGEEHLICRKLKGQSIYTWPRFLTCPEDGMALWLGRFSIFRHELSVGELDLNGALVVQASGVGRIEPFQPHCLNRSDIFFSTLLLLF